MEQDGMKIVSIADAAKELNMTPVCLRELLIRNLIPVGFGYKKDNSSRRKFIIYRGLLDSYKKQIEGR